MAFTHFANLSQTAKQLLRHVLAMGQTRTELLLVELNEERERLIISAMLGLGAAALALLAGVALTIGIVLLFWDKNPVLTAFILFAIYGGTAAVLGLRLVHLQRQWKSFEETGNQIKKDRECIEEAIH